MGHVIYEADDILFLNISLTFILIAQNDFETHCRWALAVFLFYTHAPVFYREKRGILDILLGLYDLGIANKDQ